jgi:hypothetical protein
MSARVLLVATHFHPEGGGLEYYVLRLAESLHATHLVDVTEAEFELSPRLGWPAGLRRHVVGKR